MKLIKINSDHYIIVDDSEIKEGDWFYYKHFGEDIITQAKETTDLVNLNNPDRYFKKITHSTQPLDTVAIENSERSYKLIPLQEVKELIGEVDVENEMISPYPKHMQNHVDWGNGYQRGYNQALEDNKDRKYIEEDIRKAIEMAREEYCYVDNIGGYYWSKEEIIQFLQPKTEWEVEIVDGKLKIK